MEFMGKKRLALALIKAGVLTEYLLLGVIMGLCATYALHWNPFYTVPIGMAGGIVLLVDDPREWRARSILAFRYHRARGNTADRGELPPK